MSDPWNLWTRMWWLIGRHAEVDLRASCTVTCKSCNQIYDSYESIGNGSYNQGHDICAWSIKLPDGRWVIHCGYGSSFDLSEFWYIKDFPVEPIKAICDWCILRMLRDGIIIDSGKSCTIEYDGYTNDK